MSAIDWLSQLLKIVSISGRLEVRCAYGAPWRVAWPESAAHEIPYHMVLKGRTIIEDPETKTTQELVGGDIVLLPSGSAHVLHDGIRMSLAANELEKPGSTPSRWATNPWRASGACLPAGWG